MGSVLRVGRAAAVPGLTAVSLAFALAVAGPSLAADKPPAPKPAAPKPAAPAPVKPRTPWFRWPTLPRIAKIALLEIDTPIDDSRFVVKQIQRFEKNPLIKAMVLRIDSPGGAVGPVQEILDELENFHDGGKRPIVASFGGVAASGGYYLACSADRIVSNAGTLTGSIGVIMEWPSAGDLLKKIGVEYVVVKSGRYKDTGSFSRKPTDEELKVLKSTIDDVYDQFLQEVWDARQGPVRAAAARAQGVRRVSDSEAMTFLRDIADGRVLSGRQAREAGLVDELGSFDDAVRKAAELAHISEESPIVSAVKERQASSWLDFLGNLTPLAPPGAGGPRGRVTLEYLLR